MNENIKKTLARKNEKTNELYVQEVRKAVDDEYERADEIAILRKAVAYLFDLISVLHEGEINNSEFVKYNTKIEQLKEKIKNNLNIN